MILPSSVELVQAFLKDLGNVLENFPSGRAGEFSTVSLSSNSATTVSWTADHDYTVRGVQLTSSASAAVCCSLDGTPAGGTGYFQAASKTYVGPIIAAVNGLAGNFYQTIFAQLVTGQKLYMSQTSVNLVTALFFLEKT
jgi:hypothetical protein